MTMEFTLRPKIDTHVEYSVDYDESLTLSIPLNQQQRWFKDITGLDEEEFREKMEASFINNKITTYLLIVDSFAGLLGGKA